MFKKLIVLFSLSVATLSLPVSAAFVSTDWKVEGDKSASLDMDTGLEWLDLTHTFGKSYASVESQLSTTYAGWRLPTYAEVVQLTANIFAPYGKSPYIDIFQNSVAVAKFKSMFGSSVYSTYQVGFYKDSKGVVRVTGMGDHYKEMYGLYHGYTYPVNGVGTGHGVWLVSDGGTTLSSKLDPSLNIKNPNAPINQSPPVSDVSVCASFGIVGLLLMMCGYRRRNR